MNDPIKLLHCKSRDVHWPLAQVRESPAAPQLEPIDLVSDVYFDQTTGDEFERDSPSGVVASVGQVGLLPVHLSSGSHSPVLALHTSSADANWQPLQQSSFESSQTALFRNRQVRGSQHWLPPQFSSPPQSQSSPVSTIPLPHWLPVMVGTPLLANRQSELTLFRPRAEQMLPIEQGLKLVIPRLVEGFMIYSSPASQEFWLKGQHC